MPQKEKEETAPPKSERALPMPEPESTLSQATLGSGPDVVITYEGELVEFPRYQKGGYYVVEIPEARRSRLIRGDLSVCASKNGVTVWSFPNRPGTQTILSHAPGRIGITFAEDRLLVPSDSPESGKRPLPDFSPKTQEELHSLQKELIKRIKNISDQRATDVLEQFAPKLPEPKKRLQALISDTLDFAKLTKMGEKLPLLPAAEPTTRDVHGLQKLLIIGLGKISDEDATNILDQFAPPAFPKNGAAKIRLQMLISNKFDFVTLSKMGEKIPH